jgi:hypothetical protein
MIVKISDGSQVDLVFFASKVLLTDDVFGVGLVGPFLVVGADGDLPVIRLVDGENPKDAPVDGGLILSVDNPDVDLTPVILSDGKEILVDAKIAPAIQAVVDVNRALEKALADLYSGDAVKKAIEERDAAIEERKAALERVEKIGDTLKSFEIGLIGLKEAFGG